MNKTLEEEEIRAQHKNKHNTMQNNNDTSSEHQQKHNDGDDP